MSRDTDPVLSGMSGKIAEFRLDGYIGQSANAVVYLALDERSGARTGKVALKVLAPELARDPAFRDQFLHESRAASAVDHPNIIPVYAAGDANGALYVAMRYVQGGDARSLLNRYGPLPSGWAWNIIAQAASALDAAHAAGLIHRDVKPTNMLIDAEGAPGPGSARRADGGDLGHVYLSDFGMSRSMPSGEAAATGEIAVTLDYVAPEQIEGRAVDARADQYSLACAAFELLCGSPPFGQDQGLTVMYAQMYAPPPTATAQRPDLPPAVDRVLARALAKNPADRYPGCGLFAEELGSALGLGPGEQAGVAPAPAAAISPTLPVRLPSSSRPAAAVPSPSPSPATAPAAVPSPDGAWPVAAAGMGLEDDAPAPQTWRHDVDNEPMLAAPPVDLGPGWFRDERPRPGTGGPGPGMGGPGPGMGGPGPGMGGPGPGMAGPGMTRPGVAGAGPTMPSAAGPRLAGPGFAGPGQVGADPMAGPDQPARRPPPRRRINMKLAAIGAVIVLVAVAGALGVELTRHPAPARPAGAAAPSATPAVSLAALASQQAASVNTLLGSSLVSRRALADAVANVRDCAHLPLSVSHIQRVVDRRSAEYNQARALSLGALADGATVKADLLAALRNSLAADRAYLTWARQQMRSGCTPAAKSGAYSAAIAADSQAADSKQAFVRVWNPIAAKYGLPRKTATSI